MENHDRDKCEGDPRLNAWIGSHSLSFLNEEGSKIFPDTSNEGVHRVSLMLQCTFTLV